VGQLGLPQVGLQALAGLALDGEAVVLRRDRDAAVAQVFDRMVAAAVAEAQLERLQADGAREQLVAEADPEDRLARDERADRVDEVAERGGVARAGDEEVAVRIAGEQLLGRRRARIELERRAAIGEVADDRALDAGVQRDDPGTVPLWACGAACR
jgi:hypothetical protein